MEISCPKLFDSQIQVNRKIRRAICRYLGGILLFSGKKNCSAIARNACLSHDVIQEFLNNPVDASLLLQDFLKGARTNLPVGFGTWYINIDETLIEKMYSKKMEAVASNWSSIHNDTINGHAIVVAVITNGKITIPITFKTWYSAKSFPERHQTRIQLAQELMIEIKAQYPNLMFLLDGAFSSENMLRFCERYFIKFCMRFNSNKKVVIGGKEAQIRNHELLREVGGRSRRTVHGFYKGIGVYFVAFKRKEKSGKIKFVYLVTNVKETPQKTIHTYKKRWNIEKFFRTAKQHLGLRDCQALSAAKQEVHIFAVFASYAWLQIKKFNRKAKNPEQILHKIRNRKAGDLIVKFETFCEIAEIKI
jgi:hypothetical protein